MIYKDLYRQQTPFNTMIFYLLRIIQCLGNRVGKKQNKDQPATKSTNSKTSKNSKTGWTSIPTSHVFNPNLDTFQFPIPFPPNNTQQPSPTPIPHSPSHRSAHTTPNPHPDLACQANPIPETDPTDGTGIGIATAHASKSAHAAETETETATATGSASTSAAATKTPTKAQRPALATRAPRNTASAGNQDTSRTHIMNATIMTRSVNGAGSGDADGGRKRMKRLVLFMGGLGRGEDGIGKGGVLG